MKARHLAALLLFASPAASQISSFDAPLRPDCGAQPFIVLVLAGDGTCSTSSGSENTYCVCPGDSSYFAIGTSGGGSGDVTDVWGCTSGNCNAITGASGDSLDASNADSSIPWTLGTSSFPTTEGRGKWDSSGDRLGIGNGATTSWLYPGTRAASTTDGGSATTATALAANGGNCTAASSYAIGVDASGAGECSSSPLTINAPYGQYDPDRPPSSLGTGGFDENFTSGAEDLSGWSTGNAGSSTLSFNLGAASWLAQAGTLASSGAHIRWRTGPSGSSGDFVLSGKFSADFSAAFNQGGVFVLVAGTTVTPTSIYGCEWAADQAGWGVYDFNGIALTSYTGGSTPINIDTLVGGTGPVWLQLRYVSSTKVFSCAWSTDGKTFNVAGSFSALGSHPTSTMGWGLASNHSTIPALLRADYVRACSTAACTSAPYPVGE